MAFDAFFYFPGQSKVKGESGDKEMAKNKAFEIKSFDFGAENTINIGSGSKGAGAGKATFKEFTIVKQTDTASNGIFQNLCMGTHFNEAVMELRKSGGSVTGSGATFFRVSFLLVAVQDMSWSGSDGDDTLEETIIFQYGAIKIEYYIQGADGKMAPPPPNQGAKAEFSRTTNTSEYKIVN